MYSNTKIKQGRVDVYCEVYTRATSAFHRSIRRSSQKNMETLPLLPLVLVFVVVVVLDPAIDFCAIPYAAKLAICPAQCFSPSLSLPLAPSLSLYPCECRRSRNRDSRYLFIGIYQRKPASPFIFFDPLATRSTYIPVIYVPRK